MTEGGPIHESPEEAEARQAIAALDRQLSGQLPCVSCGYNLQGLSVLAPCPECGTLVKATILAVVDPFAEELKPIRYRWVVGLGLVGWSLANVIAAIAAWVAWGVLTVEAYRGSPATNPTAQHAGSALLISLLAAAISAIGFVRPHQGQGVRVTAEAAIAAGLYAPLAYVAYQLLSLRGAFPATDPLDLWTPLPSRTVLRVLAGLLIVGILAGLRAPARALVARSLAIRAGRVDRQTISAMIVVVGVGMTGDLLGLLGAMITGMWGDLLRTIGTLLMALGALLLTGGLAGALVDCVRIARAVVRPPLSPREVFEPGSPGDF